MLANTRGRLGGALVVSVLAASTLLVAPQAQAVAATDPVGDGAAWLISQLTDDIVHNAQYDSQDYSTSVDIALALDAVGGDATKIDAIRNAVAAEINGYITGEAFGDAGSTYAGPVAKSAYLAQTTGGDATSFGGVDLIARLEALIDDTTGAANDTSLFGNYANTISQTFAAKVLGTAGSTEAENATTWLLAHQCENGGFSLDIGQGDGSCATNADADPDVTSFFLIVFGGTPADTLQMAHAIGKAEGWLLSRQKADGSFNGGASTATSNTNSTGLAGWALGGLDDGNAAEKAAIWLRRHQVQAVTGCTDKLSSQVGAIAYDDAALAAGRTGGIPADKQYQWRLGSAQALPALRWAPTESQDPSFDGPMTYVQAGGRATVTGVGITPGYWVCAGGVPGSAGANGTVAISAKVPGGATGTKTINVTVADGLSSLVAVKALAAEVLRPTVARAIVARGGKQTVSVTGLAAGEPLKIVYGGRVIKTGKATSTGTYRYAFLVGRVKGLKSVKVQGAFANRVGSKSFRVS